MAFVDGNLLKLSLANSRMFFTVTPLFASLLKL